MTDACIYSDSMLLKRGEFCCFNPDADRFTFTTECTHPEQQIHSCQNVGSQERKPLAKRIFTKQTFAQIMP
jgi:hypothetical protein